MRFAVPALLSVIIGTSAVAPLGAQAGPAPSPVGVRAQVTDTGRTVERMRSHERAMRRTPNELGRIPILEYHQIGDHDSRWTVDRDHFRRDLELLYARGYRPITISQLIHRRIDLPAGESPVVFTFDDASPSQFSYVRQGDSLAIDPGSAVGIWLAFERTHPDWGNRADFCMLPGAAAGHAFFGERGIDGQLSAWRLKKVRWLADHGFELCDHTLWHADLAKYPDSEVQEQIARGALAIDSAVPGYRVRVFALPLGVWPKNRALAAAGGWRDPRGGRRVRYRFDAILEVSGGPARSPYDPAFNPLRLPRVEVFGNSLEAMVARLDQRGAGARYVSDGDSATVARPRAGGVVAQVAARGSHHQARIKARVHGLATSRLRSHP